MRLAPAERPPGIFLRLIYRLLRRRFGRVLTPWQVVFARAPGLVPAQLGIYASLDRGISLPQPLQLLLQHHVASLNGCSFCEDIGRAVAVQRRIPLEKMEALPEYRRSPLFTPAERAALAFAEEVTREKRTSDAIFAELRRHFDERAVVEIAWLVAIETYFNLLNLPLGIGSDGLCALALERRGGSRSDERPAT